MEEREGRKEDDRMEGCEEKWKNRIKKSCNIPWVKVGQCKECSWVVDGKISGCGSGLGWMHRIPS